MVRCPRDDYSPSIFIYLSLNKNKENPFLFFFQIAYLLNDNLRGG